MTSKAFEKLLQRHNNLTNTFLAKASKTTIVVITIFIIVSQYSQFEKILTTLVTNSALIVAVLGFALQNTIKNILAGIILLSSDTFKIGDRIRLPEKSITGEIEELTLRHAVIKLITNERAIVPNSVLNDAIVINNDIKDTTTSYPLSIKVSNTCPIDKIIPIMENVIKNDTQIIHDDSEIMISHVEKDYYELKVLIKTENIDTSFKAIRNLKYQILQQLQKENFMR